jgi:superfamily II DNA or RNA helicase
MSLSQNNSNILTPYQTKFLAHWLSLEGQTENTISRSISSARVDMNPHQVEAALFALRSPLSKGVILADEVGLGKTIEASLLIAQRWAEKRRKILLVVPASLRKQWSQELADKFSLPSEIMEAKNYNQAKKVGHFNPFDVPGKILISSYQFAAKKSIDVQSIEWDLVIFDEAHKLRNIYKREGSKTSKALCKAVNERQKVLLSATPLQNSLMELYGLVSVIDPNFFGSEAAFKSQFVQDASEGSLQILRKRLEYLCKRTLRSEVAAEGGIQFTQRRSLTEDFTPSPKEKDLYDMVSSYLQRDDIASIKSGARHLVNLVIRKILASSSFAIGDTLKKMIDRLEGELSKENPQATVSIDELTDYEMLEETIEELEEEESTEAENNISARAEALQREITELKEFRALAQGIKENAKGEALIRGLGKAFEKVEGLGGRRRAVIFTESVRTQVYLKELLSSNGYEDRIVLMNGSNTDPDSQVIYRTWIARHKGTDVISGSKSSDMKAAIVEAFRDDVEVLIATESGAEGINLQFCSLVINYDLPWNPQRVEQRIGRCHRYGQKSDVVVLNFINKKNRADERVFELLNEKFKLFEGVFGASDEILGAIESGVDIEQRILSVYQSCSSTEEIEARFKQLEQDLSESLEVRDVQARKILHENFDEAVTARLKSRRATIQDSLNQFEQNLTQLICAELPEADFIGQKSFKYQDQIYSLDWKEAEAKSWNFFRLGDGSLAEEIIGRAKHRDLQPASLCFDYDQLF